MASQSDVGTPVRADGVSLLPDSRSIRSAVAQLERPAAPRVALVLLLLGAALFLFLDGHGETFWYDEWAFVLGRRGSDLSTFLDPHNGHLSLLPIVVYKALLATVGMSHYGPYRLTVITLHLLCVILIFVYAERRLGGWMALAAAVPILFLGPGWQVIIWPFEIAWLASLAAGLGALLMLDRRDRLGNVTACILIVISLSSSGLGVPITAGVLVEILLGRASRGRLWVVAVPLGLYALWYAGYSESNFASHRITEVPGFTADALAASISGLVGLAGRTIPDTGASLDWGRPLAVVAVALLAWRLRRLGRPSARLSMLLTTILAFWVLTAVSRAGVKVGGYSLAPPYSSRYIYFGGFIIVLIAVELLRDVTLTRTPAVLLAVALAAGLVAHLGAFHDAARYLRRTSLLLTANLGAIELGRDSVDPQYPAGPYTRAGPFLAAAARDGSPALSRAQIAGGSERVGASVDFVLVQIHGIALKPGGRSRRNGRRPTVEASTAGAMSATRSCVSLRPTGYHPPWLKPELDLLVPPGGLVLTAQERAPVEVSLRRFASRFPRPLGVLTGGTTAVLRIARDRAPQPWHLQLLPAGRVTACGLG